MLSRVVLVLVHDVAAIDPVLQHQVERASADRLAAPATAGAAGPSLAEHSLELQLVPEQTHRAQHAIAPEDVPHRVCFARNDDELMIAHRVAERRHAAHPHALLLRGGDLVANALAGDL